MKTKKGCGKLCNNIYSNPSVFICGEKIRGKIALCNDCLKKKENSK